MLWDSSPWLFLALVAAGIAGGFANVVAGGGSLITVPTLILAGLPEGVANGTSRLGILVQNMVAIWRFRSAGLLPERLLALIIPTVLGGAAGAGLAVWMPDRGFRPIFGGIMLFWALVVALRGDARFSSSAPRRMRPWLFTLLLFVIGVYGGFIQAAVGYLMLALFTLGMGLPLKEANVLKVLLIGAYMPIAFLIFIVSGKVDWLAGILLSAGQIAGAWIGAGVVMRGGSGVIRAILVLMVILGALELLGVI